MSTPSQPSGSNGPTMIDSSHPLYLSNADHPDFKLSSKMLQGDNYAHWRKSCEISLQARNKLGFIDGSYDKPDTGAIQISMWNPCNSMVMSWLLRSVNEDIADSLLYCATAKQIWNELEQRFQHSEGTRVFEVQQSLTTCSQGNISVSDYFTKLKKLWDEYTMLVDIPTCQCPSAPAMAKLLQNQQLMQFLMGLNAEYKTIRGNILMIKPLPSVNQAYNIVLPEEKQRSIQPVLQPLPFESSAMISHQKFPNKFSNYRQSSQPGIQRSQNNDKRDGPFCNYCRKPGHTIDKCRKLENKNKKVAATVSYDENISFN